MKYAAIIFDLDGTAMPSAHDGMPSEKLINVTKKYAQNENLCAATGRSWKHAQPVIDALGIVKPCIINGGALIISPVSHEVLWQETIPVTTARDVVSVAQRFPYKVTYSRGLTVTDHADPVSIDIAEPVNTIYILDISKGDEDEVIEGLQDIANITVSKAGAWFTDNGIDLHVTNHEATKEHAVAKLCGVLEVDSADVAGVGDGFNDIHLFKAVGHKVAMGNAVADLKASADQVIGSLDDDGLADFINASAN